VLLEASLLHEQLPEEARRLRLLGLAPMEAAERRRSFRRQLQPPEPPPLLVGEHRRRLRERRWVRDRRLPPCMALREDCWPQTEGLPPRGAARSGCGCGRGLLLRESRRPLGERGLLTAAPLPPPLFGVGKTGRLRNGVALRDRSWGAAPSRRPAPSVSAAAPPPTPGREDSLAVEEAGWWTTGPKKCGGAAPRP